MTSPTKIKRQYLNPKIKSSFSGLSSVLKNSKNPISRQQVQPVLTSIPSYTLHKDARKRYPRRKVFIPGINNQFIMDLIDISKYKKENNNNTFLLAAIDGFSKRAHVIPIKQKSADCIICALKKVFRVLGNCKYLQTDRGQEFMNRKVQGYLKTLNIKHFFTGSELKAVIIERFNRTIMTRVARYMTHKKTKRFVDVLPNLVSNYNKSYHRSILMRPIDVSVDNQAQVYLNLYCRDKNLKLNRKPKFQVDDIVLISKNKMPFEKGYAQSWSEEKFRVKSVNYTNPITYTLVDMNNAQLFGGFYNEELQKITH